MSNYNPTAGIPETPPNTNTVNGTGGKQKGPPVTNDQLKRLEDLCQNLWTSRADLFRGMFPRGSDVYKECNYPDVVTAQLYRQFYDRNPIANRTVQLLPRECWQVSPLVYETDNGKVDTEFEKAWDALGQSLYGEDSVYEEEEGSPVWSYLCKADILSGIGTFGIILLGFNDGKLLEQPLEGVSPDGRPKDITGVSDLQSKDVYGGALPPNMSAPLASTMGTDAQYHGTQFSPMLGTGGPYANDPEGGKGKKKTKQKLKLLFMRCFDESLVQVVQYEASILSSRFGQPIMYLVTLNDPRQPHTGIGLPLATVRVHWSRVVHLAEVMSESSEIFARPRMGPPFNNILNTDKIYGVSGEGYWRVGFPGMKLTTHPQLGGDVNVDRAGLTDMVADYQQHLTRTLILMGMDAETISGTVSDPTPHINVNIEAICIYLQCPVRVFKGSERGELASAQDDSKWNDILRHRQNIYLTPKVIVPFVNRLIAVGVLPKPKRFKVQWPDLESMGDVQKAQILLTKTQAYSAAIAGNLFSIIPEHEYMTKFDSLDEDQAQAMLDAAQKAEEQKQQEAQDTADEHGMTPAPPPGFQQPPTPPQGAGKPAAGGVPPGGAAGAKPPVGVPPLPAAGKPMLPPPGGAPKPAAPGQQPLTAANPTSPQGADPHAAEVNDFLSKQGGGK